MKKIMRIYIESDEQPFKCIEKEIDFVPHIGDLITFSFGFACIKYRIEDIVVWKDTIVITTDTTLFKLKKHQYEQLKECGWVLEE